MCNIDKFTRQKYTETLTVLHTSALSLFKAFPTLSETVRTELQYRAEKHNSIRH